MNPKTAGQLEIKAQEALLSLYELVEPPESTSHKSLKEAVQSDRNEFSFIWP